MKSNRELLNLCEGILAQTTVNGKPIEKVVKIIRSLRSVQQLTSKLAIREFSEEDQKILFELADDIETFVQDLINKFY